MKLSNNSLHVLKKRYLIKKPSGEFETPEELMKRVSGLANTPELEKKILEHLLTLDFLPNSPTLMNAGTANQMLSACFVLPIEDSIDSIFDSLKNTAKIHKAGGGTGFNFSHLRPEGFPVKGTSGVASGPLSFMNAFNATTETIAQGGKRRGANMGISNDTHPDLIKFIHAKDKGDTLKNFNLSVSLSDNFMNSVKNNGDWKFYWKDQITQTLKAKDIFDDIVQNTWHHGDPGIIFIDEVNRNNKGQWMDACNPCQPDFATVMTPKGISNIGDVSIGDIIWSGNNWTKIINKTYSGIKTVLEYGTTTGKFIGTSNHKIIQNGYKVEVKDAKSIDWNTCEYKRILPHNPNIIMDGLVIGDGTNHHGQILLNIGKNDTDYFKHDSDIISLIEKSYNKNYQYKITTSINAEELPNTYERSIPDRYIYSDQITTCSFLRGLFSANGSVINKRITLKQTSKILIQQVQLMLSSIGIHSYITINKQHSVKHKNGIYLSKTSYDLNITSGKNIFMDNIGFLQTYKNIKVQKSNPPKYLSSNIKDVIILGDFPVWDITVDDKNHTYWTGACLVSNCGEQFLLPYESCNLASINLNNFLDLENRNFNYVKLNILLENLVPFMNNIIDANSYPIPEIREATLKTRKIGIGVMGWADVLVKLGYRYDSSEALGLAAAIMCFIRDRTHSISKEINGGKAELNENLTTIAPTGTISIIAGVSSGIEPLFAVAYKRNLESTIGKTLNEVDPTFVSIAKDKGFYSDALIEKIIKNHGSVIGIDEVPMDVQNLFVTAHDLGYESHIKVQSVFQKYTDSAVSKTINMPNNATIDDVAKAYILAWELKCKGITIYRDGSKDQQVLITEVDISKSPIPRIRFQDHIGVVREIKTACGTFYNVMTVDEYGLFEDFQINSKIGGCEGSQKALGRATSMMLRHNVPVETIIKQFHRVDCSACITQKAKGKLKSINSCADGVSLHLQDYYKNPDIMGEIIKLQQHVHKTFNVNNKMCSLETIEPYTGRKCTECGSVNLENTKCGTCQNCGNSRCL